MKLRSPWPTQPMANTNKAPIVHSTLSFLATGMWFCEYFPVHIPLGTLEDTPEMGQHRGGGQVAQEWCGVGRKHGKFLAGREA